MSVNDLVGEGMLLNIKWAIFQLYYGKKLHFDEIMMMSALY